MRIIPISQQASGHFNQGQIIENKPIGFPQDGGFVRPYSSVFYWARAEALVDSTIGLHPHQGFEIMSFVLKGRIRHFDTKANDWKPLEAGDAQIIRAGNGISHAEHMEKGGMIFQIWLDPDLEKTMQQEATYNDYRRADIESEELNNVTIWHYAGPKGKMKLDTPGISIRRLQLKEGFFQDEKVEDAVQSVYVISGSGTINGKTVEKDDFILEEDGSRLSFDAHPGGMDVFVLTSPADPGYPTYAERRFHQT